MIQFIKNFNLNRVIISVARFVSSILFIITKLLLLFIISLYYLIVTIELNKNFVYNS